jgi:hypothetical protein
MVAGAINRANAAKVEDFGDRHLLCIPARRDFPPAK